MEIRLPFSTGGMPLRVDEGLDYEVLQASVGEERGDGRSQDEIVAEAMAHPIGSPRLAELAEGKQNVVIICSDHTRPVPSRHIIPQMLREIREGSPDAGITLLIATGCHRASTREELVQKFGEEIVARERIVTHDCRRDETAQIGILPSGAPLRINRIAAEADLLVSEGFIEPHFFAGFSGGRKSVLPGICAQETVLGNHCAAFIASPYCRTGVLSGNPVHEDMVAAARMAGLAYIVNVMIDGEKRVIHAVAGDAAGAHEAGCEFLRRRCQMKPVKPADIVITTNGGYPLDQNMYQAVKGMTAAEAAAKEDGILVMAAACADGHGGEGFYRALRDMESPAALQEEILRIPQQETKPDQWEYQIQSRILMRHKVIYVMCEKHRGMAEEMGFETASDVDEALDAALREKGREAHIAIIPDGVSVIVQQAEE